MGAALPAPRVLPVWWILALQLAAWLVGLGVCELSGSTWVGGGAALVLSWVPYQLLRRRLPPTPPPAPRDEDELAAIRLDAFANPQHAQFATAVLVTWGLVFGGLALLTGYDGPDDNDAAFLVGVLASMFTGLPDVEARIDARLLRRAAARRAALRDQVASGAAPLLPGQETIRWRRSPVVLLAHWGLRHPPLRIAPEGLTFRGEGPIPWSAVALADVGRMGVTTVGFFVPGGLEPGPERPWATARLRRLGRRGLKLQLRALDVDVPGLRERLRAAGGPRLEVD